MRHGEAPTLADARFAIDACRDTLRAGSSSFHAASLLLPSRVRRPAAALYAFCRAADDAVDLGTDKAAAVRSLEGRLARATGAGPHADADLALAAVLAHFRIPRDLPQALIEGFAWDAQGRRYEDRDALLDYAARVAGAVGAMVALVMGARDPVSLARACDLGVAMQLTNIARDVGEDGRAGRLYLPLDWLREEGIDGEAWLRDPVFTPALGRVVERLLAEAATLYDRSASGVRRLPLDCRPGIHAARLVYAAIGDRVQAAGFDSVARRAVVPTRRKLALLARAALQLAPAAGTQAIAVLPANQFLLDAVRAHDLATPATRPAPVMARIGDSAGWVADLFGRLEREDRLHASRPAWP